MDLKKIRTCVEAELELLGAQSPSMLDRTLTPASNDATSEPARYHDRCTALAKYLLNVLGAQEELQVKHVSVNTGSGNTGKSDLHLHIEFNDGGDTRQPFEVLTGLGWYLGVQRVVNATTKERPSLTPEMVIILQALAVAEGRDSRDFAVRLLGSYLRGRAAELLHMIEEDPDLASRMALRGVFPDDLTKAYESLLPIGGAVVDVTATDTKLPFELSSTNDAK